jgi:type I restriction enzyme M protein
MWFRSYHNWQREGFEINYKNIPELCYSANESEIEKNNWSLIPSKYIEFVDRDSKIDYDKEMKRIQKQFTNILNEEKDSQEKLKEAFKHLGYEIKL